MGLTQRSIEGTSNYTDREKIKQEEQFEIMKEKINEGQQGIQRAGPRRRSRRRVWPRRRSSRRVGVGVWVVVVWCVGSSPSPLGG